MNSSADQAVDLNQLYDLMTVVPGFTEKTYKHPDQIADWPTLRELIAADEVRILHYNESAPLSFH